MTLCPDSGHNVILFSAGSSVKCALDLLDDLGRALDEVSPREVEYGPSVRDQQVALQPIPPKCGGVTVERESVDLHRDLHVGGSRSR